MMTPCERPTVAVNFALSLDLRPAPRNGGATGFGSALDKKLLREIRSEADAILVGARTVATDRMRMGVSNPELMQQRLERGQQNPPLRVIVSNTGAVSDQLPFWAHPENARQTHGDIHVFSTEAMPEATRTWISRLATLHLFQGTRVPLDRMLQGLFQECGVRRVVCEGGPTLLRSLLELNLVDELYVTLCPFIFGGADTATLTGARPDFLPHEIPLELLSMKCEGSEAFLHYRVRRPEENK